jgi:hypothetical protein
MESARIGSLLAARWPPNDVVSTASLRAVGIDDRLLSRATKAGFVLRLRHGAYIPAHRWRSLSPWERDEARLDAHIEGTDGAGIYCLTSAARLHGCSVWNVGSKIHLATRYSGAGTSRASDTATHQLSLAPAELQVVLRRGRRLRVTTLLRTAADCLRILPFEQAAVVGDSALRLGLDLSDLKAALVAGSARGRQRGLRALGAMDGAAESVGETRARLLIEMLGFPRPVAQLELRTSAGLYRADYAWPQLKVILEFDGEGKYSLGPVDEALLAERRRESLLMEQGWVFVRLRWADLDRPDEVRNRIEAAIAMAGRRSA